MEELQPNINPSDDIIKKVLSLGEQPFLGHLSATFTQHTNEKRFIPHSLSLFELVS